MKVRIKKLHQDAKIPCYARPGDAALDLTTISYEKVNHQHIYGTGLAFEIPDGYVGLLFPRSSIHKTDLQLSNAVGVLDAKYRGEVKFIFNVRGITNAIAGAFGYGLEPTVYKIGERIGQILILPYPEIEFEEVQELSDTERGTGGFGSSGQ